MRVDLWQVYVAACEGLTVVHSEYGSIAWQLIIHYPSYTFDFIQVFKWVHNDWDTCSIDVLFSHAAYTDLVPYKQQFENI